jgi:hypothetical protein
MWNTLGAVSVGEYVIEPRVHEIVRAFAIVGCAKKHRARLSWLSFASLLIKCIGRSRPPYLQVQILSRGDFAAIVGLRSHIAKSVDRILV